MAVEFLPALDGALLQLFTRSDHVEVPAGRALPDRQRKAPIALLGDHPVVHVPQPVELAVLAEIRDPADLVGDIHQRAAQPVHADVPLVDQAEDKRGRAAPALRVAVRVLLELVETALLFQARDDGVGDLADMLARVGAEAIDVDAVLVKRRDHGQVLGLAEVEVLGAAAGRDVDDARALGLADGLPGDDVMGLHGRLRDVREQPAQGCA